MPEEREDYHDIAKVAREEWEAFGARPSNCHRDGKCYCGSLALWKPGRGNVCKECDTNEEHCHCGGCGKCSDCNLGL